MDNIKALISLPSTDGNFLSALGSASLAQLKYAVQIMKLNKGGKNASRINACEAQIARLDPSKAKTSAKKAKAGKATTATRSKAKTDPEELEVTPIDKSKRPKIIPFARPVGKHTYEECKAKLEKELKKFEDDDSAYVVEGILEQCKVDADFRNNVMREDKSYGKFLMFLSGAARDGYCYKAGTVGILSRDFVLDLALDYFGGEEEKTKGTTTAVPKASTKPTVTKKMPTAKKPEKKVEKYEQLSLFGI